jgi:hypothetical protein
VWKLYSYHGEQKHAGAQEEPDVRSNEGLREGHPSAVLTSSASLRVSSGKVASVSQGIESGSDRPNIYEHLLFARLQGGYLQRRKSKSSSQ